MNKETILSHYQWDHDKIKRFRQTVLRWYDEHKRPLPWRQTSDPYAIWVSEIMAQQTQVGTVIPYYERFMNTLPTVEDLAQAEESTLLSLWQGLGYYSRVRNMQKAAQQVMTQFNGEMPKTYEELQTLSGIGPYTAAAVASMAYQIPVPALDGNLFRVIARLFEIEDDIAQLKSRKVFMTILEQLIDPDRPGDFNQALMDIGATVMTPSQPYPDPHPFAEFDASYQNGTSHLFPVKSKKTKATPHDMIAYVCVNSSGEWLMRLHGENELLTGLWHYPLVEQSMIYEAASSGELLEPLLQQADEWHIMIEQSVRKVQYVPIQVKHVFSHRIWYVQLVIVQLEGMIDLPTGMTFVSTQTLKQFPISTLQQKLMKALDQGEGVG